MLGSDSEENDALERSGKRLRTKPATEDQTKKDLDKKGYATKTIVMEDSDDEDDLEEEDSDYDCDEEDSDDE